MAERRMFAKTIIDSDAFLEMPQSTQLLYFHLSMRGDDDGFINQPKTIMRMVSCKDDDIKILIAKKFVIPFESGVVVIKHWKIHNYIQNDRYNETKYKNEKSMLGLDENKSYQLIDNNKQIASSEHVYILDTQDVDTQVRLGKDRLELGKDRLECEQPPPDITQNEILILNELKKVKGYKFNYPIELAFIRKIAIDYPYLNTLNQVRAWCSRKLDEPLQSKSKPHGQLANWFMKAEQWRQEREGGKNGGTGINQGNSPRNSNVGGLVLREKV